MKGRDLSGYSSRCGPIPDSNNAIAFGCGTALADVHYHCPHCILPADESGQEGLSGEGDDDGRDEEP